MDQQSLMIKRDEFLLRLKAHHGGACSDHITASYAKLTQQVLDVMDRNPGLTVAQMREKLFALSGIEESIKQFVSQRHLCSGLVIACGTANYQEVVVCGDQQEVIMEEDGTVRDARIPLSEKSIFDLASVTKIFTCFTLMRLQEQGKIDLKKPVRTYDKRFRNIPDVTIEELMSFSPTLRTSQRLEQLDQASALEELMSISCLREPQLRPYSDMGAMVLKHIVEEVTHLPFYSVVHREILSRFGDEEFFISIPDYLKDRIVNNNYERKLLADRYVCCSDVFPGKVHDPKARVFEKEQTNLCGHAGLFSTAMGMKELSVAVLRGELLSSESLLDIGTKRIGYVNEEGKHSQYTGLLCHTKHPIAANSEVYEILSEKAFAIGGYTGNHYMLDYVNGIFSFFASNRCHNRVTIISKAHDVQRNAKGDVLWPDGNNYVDATRFAWERDDVIHKAQYYALQLAFVEYLFAPDPKMTMTCLVRKL